MLIKTSKTFSPARTLSASEQSVFSQCPTPQTFIKTELNIRHLLAVRLTSCDRVCCKLKLIKLLLQTDFNYTCAPFMPLTAQCAKTTLHFKLEVAHVAGYSCDVTKGADPFPSLSSQHSHWGFWLRPLRIYCWMSSPNVECLAKQFWWDATTKPLIIYPALNLAPAGRL